MSKVIIGADLVPTNTNRDLFIEGDAETLIGSSLKRIIGEAECRIFNLEVPLTDFFAPINKCGPNLIASTETVKGYKAIGADILTLANNHILDQNQQGLESTCKILKENNIVYLGAGSTPEEAAKPYIFSLDDKKIGLYACTEHEFSIVTDKIPGANPFDPLESPEHIEKLKRQCDFVIVLYHGGKEHYRYPSPYLQKVCRKLVEKGADLIVCQHSHCIGCEEKYKDGTIVYGQGNFLFDYSNSEFWQTSLLIEVDSDFKITYIPLVKDNNKVRLAQESVAEKILNEFECRSAEINSKEFIDAEYSKFAEKMLVDYLLHASGMKCGLLFRGINKLTGYRFGKWIVNRMYNAHKKVILRNFIECEAHRELLLRALSEE